jgi:hypothetical protein
VDDTVTLQFKLAKFHGYGPKLPNKCLNIGKARINRPYFQGLYMFIPPIDAKTGDGLLLLNMKTKDSAVSLVGPDVRSVPDSPSVRGWFSVPAEMASSAGADVRCFLCLKPKGWDAVVVVKERVGELVFYALGEYAWIDASTWRFLFGDQILGVESEGLERNGLHTVLPFSNLPWQQ